MSAAPSPAQSASRLALAADLSRYALMVMSLYFVATFVITSVVRMAHPYELHWLEGSVVDHVARVVSGESIYAAPSVAFTAWSSTPLYYWVSAGLAQVLGVGFVPLRLVSFLASAGCLLVLFRFVERETADRYAGLAAAGFYAATLPLVGEWLDMGQPDALGLFFVLLGALWLRGAESLRDDAIAALCFAAAFFTAQLVGLAALPLALHRLVAGRGATRIVLPMAWLGTVVAGTALGSWASDGWFLYYVFELPLRHLGAAGPEASASIAAATTRFFGSDLAGALPVPVALALGFAASLARARRGADGSFHLSLVLGLLVASWIQRVSLGGSTSALMPAYAGVGLYAGLALPGLVRWAGGSGEAPARAQLTALVLNAVCVVQLASLYYDPGEVIPNEVDRLEGARLVRLMAQVDGALWSPAHGHLPRLAGKQAGAHGEPMRDVLVAGGPAAESLDRDIREALAANRFGAIFGGLTGYATAIRERYTMTRMGVAETGLAYPRGDPAGRSRDVYLPRDR